MDHARGRVSSTAGEPGFAELFAALPVAALLVGPDGRIARANAACETLLNFSERAMAGQEVDMLVRFPEAHADRRRGRVFAAYDADIGIGRVGRLRVDLLESELPDRPGWRIVTLRQTPATRGHGADRAAGARAAIGAAAMLAHEIKNPLSGIRGAAQLLGEGGIDTGGQGELTTLITTEVDRIAALIDRMQDFTDTRPLKLAATNIYPLLGHARRVAVAGFGRGVTVDERFDPSLPPALVDSDALLQVVLNLLKNACEAVADQPAPRVTITTAYRHGMSASAAPGRPRLPLPIELTVTDNGPGAPGDIAAHLFEPFVSGKAEGRGLGLPLVEKLVRDMGGIVQYAREGEPEVTVFRVMLPRAMDA
ncbi:two-component system sensor histidine kinase NtrB [Sphingomonas sp.]|uniref:two-component system sensor histidine kinase NtrB n=1 Tax=Sphingomonas sp. TaxID=28214 RepID=UPI002CA36648|nr:ATP-binding protein [Sphingomonas sp.]HWK36773.1 ATP-binding protein [Sphingomonas sp.]